MRACSSRRSIEQPRPARRPALDARACPRRGRGAAATHVGAALHRQHARGDAGVARLRTTGVRAARRPRRRPAGQRARPRDHARQRELGAVRRPPVFGLRADPRTCAGRRRVQPRRPSRAGGPPSSPSAPGAGGAPPAPARRARAAPRRRRGSSSPRRRGCVPRDDAGRDQQQPATSSSAPPDRSSAARLGAPAGAARCHSSYEP